MIYKLEKKFGKFAINNLMVYVSAMYVIGWVIDLINPVFYYDWLMLDVDKVMHGQVWRILTFLIQPVEQGDTGTFGVFFMLISLYLYFFIGRMLEGLWGAFRFNLFYFSGVLCNILAVLIIYAGTYFIFGTGISFPITLNYINLSMFLAFAMEFSDVEILLFFLFPVKIKYIGILYAVIEAVQIVRLFLQGGYFGACMAVAFLVAMLNFLIFFIQTREYRKGRMSSLKRRVEYNAQVKRGEREAKQYSVVEGKAVVSRHRCVVCGRTELDSPDLEFRFCSKCEGNYEYCMDHLYTHVHVVRVKKDADGTAEENAGGND